MYNLYYCVPIFTTEHLHISAQVSYIYIHVSTYTHVVIHMLLHTYSIHTYRDLHRAHSGGKHTDDRDAPPVRCHGRGGGRGKSKKLLDA